MSDGKLQPLGRSTQHRVTRIVSFAVVGFLEQVQVNGDGGERRAGPAHGVDRLHGDATVRQAGQGVGPGGAVGLGQGASKLEIRDHGAGKGGQRVHGGLIEGACLVVDHAQRPEGIAIRVDERDAEIGAGIAFTHQPVA